MVKPHTPSSAYLPAEAVMALSNLQLRARCVADGVLAGLHSSQRRGESAEFAEHKLYSPGDDLRRVDWKALAKSDRHYVKRFIEETSLNAVVILDSSGSMAYPERGRFSKYDYAATLSAALAMLLLKQGDPVGLIQFSSAANTLLEAHAKKSQLFEFINNLKTISISGETQAAQVFAQLGQRLKRRSLVLVLSDMLDVVGPERDFSALLKGLATLRARGADVALMHILDPDERDLPFHGLLRFIDIEGDASVQVDVDAIRSSYQQELADYTHGLRQSAENSGLRYSLVTTDAPPAEVLARFVAEGHHLRWN